MRRLTFFVTLGLLGLGVVAVALSVRSLFVSGIGWDSTFDTEASLVSRLVDPSMTLAQAYEAVPVTSEFYGVLVYQLSDALRAAFMGATEWMPPLDPDTYVWQGLTNIAISTLAAITLGMTVAVVLRSRLAGAFSFGALLTTPLWLGMSAIDLKDMSVAAGLTLVACSLSLAWTRTEVGSVIGCSLLGGLGAFLALGTRAGSVAMLFALTGGTVIVLAFVQVRVRARRPLGSVTVVAAASLMIGFASLWLTNPIARIDMPTWLSDAYDISRQYGWEGLIRTAGQDLPSDALPWWYAPVWLSAQLPVLTLLAIVAGLALLMLTVVGLRTRRAVLGRADVLTLTPLLIQAMVLPVAIVVSGAVLYDGIRHLLFMFPGLITITAFGIASVERSAVTAGMPRSRGWIAPFAASMIVVMGLFAVARWYPYHYAFVNPIAGWNKEQRDWELDYWGVTAREGVTRVREAGRVPVVVSPAVAPSLPFEGKAEREVVTGVSPWQKYGLYVFRRWDARIPEQRCSVLFTIERDGHVLGEGGYCPK